MGNYHIRPFNDRADFEKMQQLEKDTWDMAPIPIHQTLTAHKNGGLLLGAFQEESLIGFSYGFAGFSDGSSYLCSHMLGIHPDYQKRGIGEALKHAQKREAARLGYEQVTWTFDPLEGVNAYLNLTKLKAVCSTYEVNCYGKMNDGLNAGLPTDRLKVDWWIQSDYVNSDFVFSEEQAKVFAEYGSTEEGCPKISLLHPEYLAEEALLVPVPRKFQEIKRHSFDLALKWRLDIREIFVQLFASGYTAVKLIQRPQEPVNYYLFVKDFRLTTRREEKK
ncbi:GNAT family N-acetyltransferase [Pseudobacillus badius]|uniref:GNAT family N-acetyltransferase n=1 Tax=Bacillus badius TaxID=1455 RepID=UPI000A5145CF|nr:GNAT family N-acetyltransferase [Bacillus badius]TDW05729.1 putative GNAT superfamily acetyltransferase [Bacillus badius]